MFRPRTPEPRFLTRDEFNRLLAELPPHLKLCARFAVLTGLRMRSMLQLEWPRVDLTAKRAWVPASHMKAGKTHGVPLSGDAVKVLRELRAQSPEGERVFQWNGKGVDDCNGRGFKSAVTRARLDPLRWHDLRHTWASWAVQAGVTLQELMQLGGWASYSMVLRYAHLAPDHLANTAERIAKSGQKQAQIKNRKR